MIANDALALALLRRSAIASSDPLAEFTFEGPGREGEWPCPREHAPQRRAIASLLAGLETLFRSGNDVGKTWGMAAAFVALAEGRPTIGPLSLPRLGREPTTWWVITEGYKSQIDGPQKAILHWLGDWPHDRLKSNQVPDALQMIRVAPWGRTAIDPVGWNRIWFFVHGNADALPGAKIDGVWADEPPPISMWYEAVSRRKRGRRFFSAMTLTPVETAGWKPIRERFEGCEETVVGGRIEIRCTIFDNPWLSEQDIRVKLETWRDDPHKDARVTGAYVNVEGQCPFPQVHTSRWLSRCRTVEPRPLDVWVEQHGDGETRRIPLSIAYEEFWPPEEDEVYYADADPSLGLRQKGRHRSAFHVYARRRPRLVARFHDYLPPYALGWALGLTAQRFSRFEAPDRPGFFRQLDEECLADVEMNDGLGLEVLRGCRDAGHWRIYIDTHDDKTTGAVETRYGWRTTWLNRGAFISSCQRMLMDDSVLVVSRGVVETLMQVEVGPKGREDIYGDNNDGNHAEDMVLLGRFGHVSAVMPPPPYRPPQIEELFMRELGKDPRVLVGRDQREDEAPWWGPSAV